MASTFAKPVNDFSATLASAHAVNATTLVLATGAGALLGSLPANRIYRVTAVLNPQVPSESILGVFEATGLTGDTLTGVTGAEGFANVALAAGTTIEVRVTAKDLSEVQDAVNALESAGYLTAPIAESQVTGLVADLAGKQPVGAYLTSPIAESDVTGLVGDLSTLTSGVSANASTISSLTTTVGGKQAHSTTLDSLAAATYTTGDLLGGDGTGVPVAMAGLTYDPATGNLITPLVKVWRNGGTGTALEFVSLLGSGIFFTVPSGTVLFSASSAQSELSCPGGAYTQQRLGYGTDSYIVQLDNGANVRLKPSVGLSLILASNAVDRVRVDTSGVVAILGISSTATARDLAYIDASFVGLDTDSTYLGKLSLRVQDHGNNAGGNPNGWEGLAIESTGSGAKVTLPGTVVVSGTTTAIPYLDASGTLGALTVGTGLSLASGTLTATGGGGGSGTVTSVSVATANGVSGTVATATTTPAITLTLGAITPSTVNGVTLSGSSTPTLAVTGTANLSGTNTGDQDISGIATNAAAIALKAPLASPALTGVPTAPTATVGTNTTQLATTAFVLANAGGGGGSGTVTSVSVTTANGVSGSVATSTTTPAITLTLGAITPSSVAATGPVSAAGAVQSHDSSGTYSEFVQSPAAGLTAYPRTLFRGFGSSVTNNGMYASCGNASGSTQITSFLGVSTNADVTQVSSKQLVLWQSTTLAGIFTWTAEGSSIGTDLYLGGSDFGSGGDSPIKLGNDGSISLRGVRNAVDDAAAAALSPAVPVGGLYRNGSVLMIRVT
jgi:hypothetical protein